MQEPKDDPSQFVRSEPALQMWHVLHSVAPLASWYVKVLHGLHCIMAARFVNWPGAQLSQATGSELDAAAVVRRFPAAQEMHASWALAGWNVPGRQVEHARALSLLAGAVVRCEPAAQLTHDSACEIGW